MRGKEGKIQSGKRERDNEEIEQEERAIDREKEGKKEKERNGEFYLRPLSSRMSPAFDLLYGLLSRILVRP